MKEQRARPLPMTLAATPSLAAPARLEGARLLPAGTRLDEFEILRPLGVGGFGIVYLALDHSLLRQVALKEFMPAELAGRGADGILRPHAPDCVEPFQRGLESFYNEARLLAPFNHPALVRVFRFWKANGTAYMAMQYCPGVTLAEARRRMRVAPDEAWLRAVIDPLLGALERLHRAGVFHRDISPDNILLLPNGRPILLDFGSARRVIGAGTRSLTAVLKPNFAPIEQYGDETGMPQGPWTDLYALGATVQFMLTGEAPTPAVLRVVNDLRKPLGDSRSSAFPGVGARFLAAIDWTAAIEPKDRPQSVAALRQALADDKPATPPTLPAALAAPTAPAAKPRRALAALVLALVGVLGVGTWKVVVTAPREAKARVDRVAPVAAPVVAATLAPAAVHAAATPVAAKTTEPPPSVSDIDGDAAHAQRPRSPKRPTATAASRPGATAPRVEPNAVAARPAQACSGLNIIARAICVSRQCQRAGSRNDPECVEAQRIEEQRQRRMDR